jgi:hypothetical protein
VSVCERESVRVWDLGVRGCLVDNPGVLEALLRREPFARVDLGRVKVEGVGFI